MSRRDGFVVAGALAQRPGRGGHAWVFLQYLLGLKQLGWDVLFVDWIDPAMCTDEGGRPAPVAASRNLRILRELMEAVGLGESYCLLDRSTGEGHGRTRAQALEHVGRAAGVLNVMGYLDDEELLGAAARRIFLDIDPGFGQMWHALGLADPFSGHDAHVTIGENIGAPGCGIPTCGIDWITTPQPIVLSEWPEQAGEPDTYSTVASWRGAFGPIDYEGKRYGLRAHEFRRFAEIPRRTGEPFEVALDIDPADDADRVLLEEGGWRLADPREVAADAWSYRSYVQRSRGEFMVAKNMYVETRSGWFSDRSICYLASGRPVLAQDTGIPRDGDKGLVLFSTVEEAVEGVAAIREDYGAHARAAREIAESRFESGRVLGRLLGKLGIA